MTGQLAERLHEEATAAPPYDVYDRSLRTARRRRITTWAAVIVVIALAVPLGSLASSEANRVRRTAPADGAAEPALPDLVGLPGYGAAHVGDHPELGAAMVFFSAWGSRMDGLSGDGDNDALVGEDGDYQVGPLSGGLLSPDGRTVAYADGKLLDLGDGRTRTGFTGRPLAWAPDGRHLIVLDGEQLGLITLGGGTVELGALNAADPVSAEQLSVAYSPDGTRFAYVLDHRVYVADAAGHALFSFVPPGGYRLAGKGSWSWDGLSFALVNTGDQVWRPLWFDGRTGLQVPNPGLPSVTFPEGQAVAGDELLGWLPDRSALVLGPVEGGRRRLLALEPFSTRAAAIMVLPGSVTSLDIADVAIASGRTSHVGQPFIIGPRLVVWLILIAAVIVATWLARRRFRWPAQRRAMPWKTVNGEIA